MIDIQSSSPSTFVDKEIYRALYFEICIQSRVRESKFKFGGWILDWITLQDVFASGTPFII